MATVENIPLADNVTTMRLVANAVGGLYGAVLDAALANRLDSNLSLLLSQKLATVPDDIKSFYSKVMTEFWDYLRTNHQLLQQHQGNEVRFILDSYADSSENSKIGQALSQLDVNKFHFSEPAMGVLILQTDLSVFRELHKAGTINLPAAGLCHFSATAGKPSFIIVANRSGSPLSADPTIRHEMHHFFWQFLYYHYFITGVNEKDGELGMAFLTFKDEAGAYLIEGRDLNRVDLDALLHRQNSIFFDKARIARGHLGQCINLATILGLQPYSFLYPLMIATSFEDLEEKISIIASVTN